MNVLTECLAQGTSPVGVVSFAKEYLKQQGFPQKKIANIISPHFQMYYLPLQQVLEKK